MIERDGFNREAISVDSRGLRRIAATPGRCAKRATTPKGLSWDQPNATACGVMAG
jgi:hypothetical protein